MAKFTLIILAAMVWLVVASKCQEDAMASCLVEHSADTCAQALR